MTAIDLAKRIITELDKVQPYFPGQQEWDTKGVRKLNFDVSTPEGKAAAYLFEAAVKRVEPGAHAGLSAYNDGVFINSESYSAHQLRAALKTVEKDISQGWQKGSDGEYYNSTLIQKNISLQLFDAAISAKADRLHDISDTPLKGELMTDYEIQRAKGMGASCPEISDIPLVGVQLSAQQVNQAASVIGFKSPVISK